MPAALRFKEGVIPYRVHPELVTALSRGAELFFEMFGKHLWVTSLADGKHSSASRHYPSAKTDWYCAAADTRVWGLSEQDRTNFVLAWGAEVNAHRHVFDIVDEEDHIHIEYDPK